MLKKNKGITLIALIITIIIMLILVAVSIDLIVNDKLFNSAGEAVNKTNEKVGQQQGRVDELMGILGEVEESQRTDAIPGRKVTENKPYYSNGKTAIIPGGFTVSGVPSEASIDGGLVIYLIDDKTDEEIAAIDWTNGTTVANLQKKYDQFVWIPIKNTTDANAQDINDMYICQNKGTGSYGTGACTITVINEKATCTAHSNCTAMAGYLYTNTAMTTRITRYTANSGLREPDIVTDYDNNTTYLGNLNGILGTNFYPTTDTTNNTGTANTDFKTYLQEEYNEIVKSVYENQGFYVGRYETSNITTTDGTAIKVVAGTTPGNNKNWYYMYAQQKDYTTNKGLRGVGSTMIQGAAYDQVMKFVNTANYNVTTAENVGHTNSEFTTTPYQTGGRDYSETTPYNDVSKNIYDLEGNVMAWTTEADDPSYRVYRGGSSNSSYAASRRDVHNPDFTTTNFGSLPQLYVK